MRKIRKIFRQIVATLRTTSVVKNYPNLLVRYGTGMGNVANVPWVAILDGRETKTTTKGIYVVFLFKADMTGLYLTLNQGVGKTVTASPTMDHVERLEKLAGQIREELEDKLSEVSYLITILIWSMPELEKPTKKLL